MQECRFTVEVLEGNLIKGEVSIPGRCCAEALSRVDENGSIGAVVTALFNTCLDFCKTLLDFGSREITARPGVLSSVSIEATPVSAECTAQTSDSSDWWPVEGLERLRALKKRFGFTDNSDFDPYIRKFSNGLLQSWEDITPENILAFCEYLENID
ncbi:MAG: hypothetical protein AB1330_01115 [Bacillota bacterium]